MNTRKLLVSVLMLVSVLFSACAPAATLPVLTVAPPTEVPIVFASTPAPGLKQPKTFSSGDFEIPLTLIYTGWTILEEYPDVVSLVSDDYYVDLAFILVKDIKLADPKNSFAQVAFPDDFVTWIQEHGLFPVVETQSVVIAGFQGTEINAIVTSDCGVDKKSWLFYSSNAWNCRTGEYYHFIYLEDVYGERLLIMNSGGPASEKDFDLGVEASQKVLNTVVFLKP